MCVLRPPFMARNFKELRRSVLIGAYPPLPPFYSEELNLLVKALLQMDPKDRPTAEELLKNPYLNKKCRRVLEAKLERTTEEPRRSLMRTIKMKDLASLKHVLPGPNYRPEEIKGRSVENSARLLLDERDLRSKTEDNTQQVRIKHRSNINSGIISAEGSLADHGDEQIKQKIMSNKNHFAIKVRSHQVSVNNSLAEDAEIFSKRDRMPDIKPQKLFDPQRVLKEPPLRSRRGMEPPIKQHVSLDIALPSHSRPVSRSEKQPDGFLPKFPRKLITSNLLNQKKSSEFKLSRVKEDDIIDELIYKKDSARGKKGIWATDDPRVNRLYQDSVDSRLELQVERVRLPEESQKELFNRRKHRNIS
jgi:serine/threonine protein kinase